MYLCTFNFPVLHTSTKNPGLGATLVDDVTFSSLVLLRSSGRSTKRPAGCVRSTTVATYLYIRPARPSKNREQKKKELELESRGHTKAGGRDGEESESVVYSRGKPSTCE